MYARYLFPLLAPLFTVLIYLFYKAYKPGEWQRKVPELFFGWVLVLCAIAMLVLPMTGAVKKIEFPWIKAFICAVLLGASAWYYFRQPVYRLMIFCVALFFARLAFNWFVIDQRGTYLRKMEANAVKIVELSKGRPLYLETGVQYGNFDGMSYHISRRRNEILRFSKADTTSVFITDSTHLAGKKYIPLFDFDNIYADHLWLVRYQNGK